MQFTTSVPWHTLTDQSCYFMSHCSKDGASAHSDPVFHSSLGQQVRFQDIKIGVASMCWNVGIWSSIGTEAPPYRTSELSFTSRPETLLFISPTASHCFWQVAAPFFDVCLQWVIDAYRGLLSTLSQSQMNKWIDHLYHSERARLEESFLSGKQTPWC